MPCSDVVCGDLRQRFRRTPPWPAGDGSGTPLRLVVMAAAAVPARIRLGEIAPDMVRLEACSKRLPTKLTSRVSAGQTIKQDHLTVLE